MSAVFVTGATGTVGRSVLTELIQRGENVIAAVRDDAAAQLLPEGVEARKFDFADSPEAITKNLTGADRLFLMRPPQISDVRRYLFPVIDCAQELRIRHIAFLSLQGVQGNRKTPHFAVEQYLKDNDAPYTFLRPNFFMQNFSTVYAPRIREDDEIFVPAGRAYTAFIDARDVGKVAGAVLGQPGHVQRAYTLSGSTSLTYQQVARIMSEELGRTIRYSRPSEKDFLHALAADGAPQDYIEVQKMIHRVVRMNISALPNQSIQKLTGQPAISFRQFVREHRSAWEMESLSS